MIYMDLSISDNSKFIIHHSLVNNNMNNIQQIFHFENRCDIKYEHFSGISIFSYNVHSLINPNSLISIHDNISNIFNLINNINADIVLLQEISFSNISHNAFLDIMHKIGYNYYTLAHNGYIKNSLYIGFFTKQKHKSKIIDLTVHKYYRQCIIIYSDTYSIAGVHLEVKDYKLRLQQLQELLKHNPDMIIGDFNFTLNSIEGEQILKHYKTLFSEKKQRHLIKSIISFLNHILNYTINI